MRQETQRHDIRTWGGVGSVFGFVGGILAALFGSLLTAAACVSGAELHTWLQAFATALLVSTIPLLALGACCLDGLEARTKHRAVGGRAAKTSALSFESAPSWRLARA